MARPNLAEKDILNPEEAIRYWNLSRRKFYRFLSETDGEISLLTTEKES
jgi:hypothetical protein